MAVSSRLLARILFAGMSLYVLSSTVLFSLHIASDGIRLDLVARLQPQTTSPTTSPTSPSNDYMSDNSKDNGKNHYIYENDNYMDDSLEAVTTTTAASWTSTPSLLLPPPSSTASDALTTSRITTTTSTSISTTSSAAHMIVEPSATVGDPILVLNRKWLSG